LNFTIIIKLIGTKNMGSEAYSLYLNEVRKNLTSNLDRSPLTKEPLSKSYGVSASPEACRCKAQREANGLSPWRGQQRSRCMLQDLPCGAFSAIRTRRCDFLAGYSMPAKSRLDSESRCKPGIPIGLAQRLRSINIVCQISPELRSLHAICGLRQLACDEVNRH